MMVIRFVMMVICKDGHDLYVLMNIWGVNGVVSGHIQCTSKRCSNTFEEGDGTSLQDMAIKDLEKGRYLRTRF